MATAQQPFTVTVPGVGHVRYQPGETVPDAHAALAPDGVVTAPKKTKKRASKGAETPTAPADGAQPS